MKNLYWAQEKNDHWPFQTGLCPRRPREDQLCKPWSVRPHAFFLPKMPCLFFSFLNLSFILFQNQRDIWHVGFSNSLFNCCAKLLPQDAISWLITTYTGHPWVLDNRNTFQAVQKPTRVPYRANWPFKMYIFFFIWKENGSKKERVRANARERILLSTGSLPSSPQWLVLGQPNAELSTQNPD